MLEAEISASGTVLVEGHHVGELQGFRFTADQSAAGEDGKAIRAAAQKALAAEFETRAERFAACANGDIALGSDGVLRWIGAPIGTLAAGEDPLKPRVILLSDEQLTGPARDKVAARAERFVNFQIESLLKPLIDLKDAEQIAGIGRGIAFRLVEEYGLINRREIAKDVKSLDQAGRAALRRLGVRFGAYHIFVPALVKPAPAGLITLLWALKNDGKDRSGFGDVVNALATGRTSVVIDPAFDKTFYKLAGFRALGRRAVRVDILERLADLIRPALAWKAGLGPRPDGAFDGQAFMVTPAMMSILGANAEDMEEVLKGLGYRAEPKPAEDVKTKLEALDQAARVAAAKAEAEKAEAAAKVAEESRTETPGGDDGEKIEAKQAESSAETSTPSDEGATPGVSAPLEAATWTPDAGEAPDLEAPVSSPLDVSTEAIGSGSDQEPDTASITAAETEERAEPVEMSPAGQTESDQPPAAEEAEGAAADPIAASSAEAPAEEPKPILLWRPGRFDRPAGGRRNDNRHRHGRGQADGEGGGRQHQGGRPPFQGRRNDKDGEARQKFAGGKERPDGRRPDFRKGKQRDGKDGERGQQKPAFQPRPREERPAKIDPLSPFAKLAALRDQLKK